MNGNSLPERWVSQTLQDAALVVMGQSPPGHAYNESGSGLPFFQGKAEFGVLYPAVKKWSTMGNKVAEPGDILLSVRAPVGPTNIAPVQCIIGRGLAAIRAKPHVDQTFLLWSLRNFEEQISSRGTGTTFDSISGDSLRSQTINIPPKAEQQRIVAILEEQLSRLDAAISSIRNVREKAAQFRRSLLHTAFSGKLTGGRKMKGVDTLSTARNSQFSELFEVVPSSARQFKQREYRDEGKFPVVDQGELLVSGFANDENLVFSGGLPIIVFGDHTRRFKYVDFPFVVGADGTKLIRCKGGVLDRFGYYHLEAITLRNRGYARHYGELRKQLFWLPPLEEQQAIVSLLEEQLSRLDASLSFADAVERKAQALRRSVLYAALAGELTRSWRKVNA